MLGWHNVPTGFVPGSVPIEPGAEPVLEPVTA